VTFVVICTWVTGWPT